MRNYRVTAVTLGMLRAMLWTAPVIARMPADRLRGAELPMQTAAAYAAECTAEETARQAAGARIGQVAGQTAAEAVGQVAGKRIGYAAGNAVQQPQPQQPELPELPEQPQQPEQPELQKRPEAAGSRTPGGFEIVPQARRDSLAHPGTAAGSEVMRFETRRIDTGTIGEGAPPSSYTFRWHNDGTQPLVITRVQTTCGCTTARYDRQPIAAGATGEVEVIYNPRRHPGSFLRKIFIYTQLSERQPTAILELSGKVTPALLPTDEYPYVRGSLRLKQQEVRIEGTRRQTERIECLNAGGEPLRIAADTLLLPKGLALVSEPETIAPGQVGDLIVRFDPAQVAGALPERVPLLLEGLTLPPSQRTIYVRFGGNANER